MRALVSASLRQPLAVFLLAVIFIGFGWFSLQQVPIDAIPNVGENQVIVLTAWPGRSPQDIEDQVTYPLSASLLAVPEARSVRGKSLFGYSFIQVTFDDSTDFYWARARVAEQLGTAAAQLPEGVVASLGPDATGLGQVLYYVLEPSDGMSLADLRSLQDFVVKYELQAVPGVSEVASVGGYVQQYQIEVDPDRLRFHRVTIRQLLQAIRESNQDISAKTIESGGMEFIIRGLGLIGADAETGVVIEDIEQTVVRSENGLPLRVRDLANVQLGPDFRRGAIDLNGTEAVGGVVVMRHGENPRQVIQRVRERIRQIEPGLGGVRVRAIYDRTDLIDETVSTLTDALGKEILVTIIVILLFLLHLRASLVIAATLPIAVLIAFLVMYVADIDANIMSLAGIAIAIGTMVDMGIIVSETIYDRLAEWEQETAGRELDPDEQQSERDIVIRDATAEVSPAVLTAVLTTVVSFLPVFLLTGRDYRLFAPLAWTKTASLLAALLVAILLVPSLCRLLLRTGQLSRRIRILAAILGGSVGMLAGWFGRQTLGSLTGWNTTPLVLGAGSLTAVLVFWLLSERLRPARQNPISRLLLAVYEPTLRFFLGRKLLFLSLPVVLILVGLVAWLGLQKTLAPVESLARQVDADLQSLPGYQAASQVFSGLESDDWIALDEGSWFYMPTLYPAASFSQAFEILQTQDMLIRNIPEVKDVLGKIGRVESALDPAPAAMIETYVMLKPRSQWRPGVTNQQIWEQINGAGTMPGVTPASPLQPIEGRVVMLQSGIKAAMAVRITGDSLEGLSVASRAIADLLKTNPAVASGTINPDIVLGKPYLEFEVDRESAARYGMTISMVNEVIAVALGGIGVSTTVEGRERYQIRVRYQRDLREQMDDLDRLPVVTHSGDVVPLGELARMSTAWGPGMINSENTRLVAHVSFSPSGEEGDLATVASVEKQLTEARSSGLLSLPPGYSCEAVGSFQNQIEANQRLMWVIPLVMAINFILIRLQFRDSAISLIVFAGIPVAFAGGMICLALNAIEMNTAVWIGFIALFGIAVDDGVVMATLLNQVFQRKTVKSVDDIRNATVEAGLRRIRPCLMTTITTIIALTPIVLSTGRGADVAKAMAWPVAGGMTVELLTLFVVPVVFSGWQELRLGWRMNGSHPSLTEPVESAVG